MCIFIFLKCIFIIFSENSYVHVQKPLRGSRVTDVQIYTMNSIHAQKFSPNSVTGLPQSVKMSHFLLLFAIICIQMACFKKVKELRGVFWYQWFNTCIEECPALVSPAQVFNLLRNCQNAPQGHEIIERSITQ